MKLERTSAKPGRRSAKIEKSSPKLEKSSTNIEKTLDHNYHNPSKDDMKIETSAKIATISNKSKEIRSTPERVLDLVKRDEKDEVKCLVKYKGIASPEWVSAHDIRKLYPLLLIDYYETRIILRKNQIEMAFDCTTPSDRKLVVITSK